MEKKINLKEKKYRILESFSYKGKDGKNDKSKSDSKG